MQLLPHDVHGDPAIAVGHVAAAGSVLLAWVGALGPVMTLIVSCTAFAWYCAMFYDRAQKRKKTK